MKKTASCNFGEAIEALKQGELVARKGWNGKGMFVMKQIPANIGLDIIPKMQSVQQSAKDKLIERGTTLHYKNQMLIIKLDGTADSWVPSSSDVFAEDWEILSSDTVNVTETFKDRLVIEEEELRVKYQKLRDFIGGSVFEKLDLEDKNLLVDQHSYMSNYVKTLQKRLDRLS